MLTLYMRGFARPVGAGYRPANQEHSFLLIGGPQVVSYVHMHAEFILSDRICIRDFGAATLTRMEKNPEDP